LKLFIDTANIAAIKRINDQGLLDGVTTNPSLLAKEKRPALGLLEEIFAILGNRPVNVELITETVDEMVEEAKQWVKRYEKAHPVIKIPMTPEGLVVVKKLSEMGIHTNVTLIFSSMQALLCAKAGATYVSPFVGRLDDISAVGMDLIREIMSIYENYSYQTQVIVASIRHPLHVIEAALAGAHVSTIPPDVIDKLAKHPLTDIGIARFKEDYAKIPKE
jgi:transaldolase